MSVASFTPEIAVAIHKLVYTKYAKAAGVMESKFSLRFDPELVNELHIKIDYETNSFIITCRYLPIGEMAERFHIQMRNFFSILVPRFVMNAEDGRIEKYNSSFHSLSLTGWNTDKKREKVGKFKITNLAGVRVVDLETGTIVEHIAENTTLQRVREMVISTMYKDT